MDIKVALTDCREQHRKYPATFEIPTEEELRAVKVGGIVKLHFIHPNPGPRDPPVERMWVKVTTLGPKWEGKLDNDPGWITQIQCGDVVNFEDKHIGSVWGAT